MKLTLNGFDEDQFRWCFWGSDNSVDDADSMAGGVASTGTATSSDMSADDYDSMDSAPVSFGPQTPSRGAGDSVGVLTPDYRERTYGLDYTSPNLISNVIGPRQMTVQDFSSRGGLNISPYSPNNVSFSGGVPSITVDPLAGPQNIEFDMGVPPTVIDDRNFVERAIDNFGNAFSYQPQRAVQFDPMTNRFTDFGGSTTLEKVSDNPIQDFIGNLIATPFSGLTGYINTKAYAPLVGGEEQQYTSATGGLLSGLIDGRLTPYSELGANVNGDSNGDDTDAIRLLRERYEQELANQEESAPSPIEQITYTPTRISRRSPVEMSDFYTIPSRFGLLS